jgi:hypothetical protein
MTWSQFPLRSAADTSTRKTQASCPFAIKAGALPISGCSQLRYAYTGTPTMLRLCASTCLQIRPLTVDGPFPPRSSPLILSTCHGTCLVKLPHMSCQFTAFHRLSSGPSIVTVFWTFPSCQTRAGSSKFMPYPRPQLSEPLCRSRFGRPSSTAHARAFGAMISARLII